MERFLVDLRVVLHHGVFQALQQSHRKPRHQELYRSQPTIPQTGNQPRKSTSSLTSLIRRNLHTDPPASHPSYDNRTVCVPMFIVQRCGRRKEHPRSQGPSLGNLQRGEGRALSRGRRTAASESLRPVQSHAQLAVAFLSAHGDACVPIETLTACG